MGCGGAAASGCIDCFKAFSIGRANPFAELFFCVVYPVPLDRTLLLTFAALK